MKLILFRHGIAEDESPAGDDGARRLTEEGRRRTAEAARGLARLIHRPDVILTSPKVRAAQTAKIIAAAFDGKIEPRPMQVLAGGSSGKIAHQLVGRPEGLIVAVGHEPTLSQAAAILCGDESVQGFIALKKAGCVCLRVEKPGAHATLLWLATPKLLRNLKH